jgi:hypothetical protein
MSGLLAGIYSAGDTAKRKLRGLLDDPIGTIQQQIGLLNDNAGKFNQLHSQATQESVNAIKKGGSPMGPASVALSNKLADAYNPIGMIAFKGTQDEALEAARRNAVKMLGLPENNTAMDRAKALGFDVSRPLYHGTSADVSEFNPAMYGTNTRAAGDELGIFTTAKRDLANNYAEIAGKGGWHGRREAGNANVMPLLAKMDSPKKYETASGFYRDADAAAHARKLGEMRAGLKAEGFDSVQVRPDMEEVVLFEPNQLRSRFAAFDPARIKEADLLGRVDLRLLGLLGIGAGGGAYMASDK